MGKGPRRSSVSFRKKERGRGPTAKAHVHFLRGIEGGKCAIRQRATFKKTKGTTLGEDRLRKREKASKDVLARGGEQLPTGKGRTEEQQG